MSQKSVVLRAFTEEQAAELSGIKRARLRRWNRIGFFTPSFRNEPDPGPYNRLYSFKDVVCLRTLGLLVNEHKIRLPVLRDALKKLLGMDQSRWATETLYVLGKRVYFDPPEINAFQDAGSGQLVLHNIPLQKVQRDVEKAVVGLRGRDRSAAGKVGKARGVRGSRPVVKGTRIPVSIIKDLHDEGLSIGRIRDYYPSLSEADIREAIRFSGGKAA